MNNDNDKYEVSFTDGSTQVMKRMTAVVVIDSHHFDIFHIEKKKKVESFAMSRTQLCFLKK